MVKNNQEGSEERVVTDVIDSLESIIQQIRGRPVTKNCTPPMIAQHTAVLALQIRDLLLEYGPVAGWKIAKEKIGRGVYGLTFLDRELTDEELGILEKTLGCEFSRNGYVLGTVGAGYLRDSGGGG